MQNYRFYKSEKSLHRNLSSERGIHNLHIYKFYLKIFLHHFISLNTRSSDDCKFDCSIKELLVNKSSSCPEIRDLSGTWIPLRRLTGVWGRNPSAIKLILTESVNSTLYITHVASQKWAVCFNFLVVILSIKCFEAHQSPPDKFRGHLCIRALCEVSYYSSFEKL
jgi:hypothetical protein